MGMGKKKHVPINLKTRLDILSEMALSGVRITIERVMRRLNVDEREAIRIVRDIFIKSDSGAEIR